jgi:hypothetical protein
MRGGGISIRHFIHSEKDKECAVCPLAPSKYLLFIFPGEFGSFFFVAQCQTPPANPPVMYYTEHKIRNDFFFSYSFLFHYFIIAVTTQRPAFVQISQLYS